ncbi:MAG: cysteine-rich CWC family protein [Flavobacteriales bacterium]|nr:cysteine-rich CWC family protein [Flavobacteriales bacterium]
MIGLKVATPDVQCARCGVAITCSPTTIASCACSKVAIDSATRDRIARGYSGCLCNGCLQEEQEKTSTAISGR